VTKEAETMEPKTFHTPYGLRLEVRIPAGTIHVRAEDRADTMLEITGERDPGDLRIELDEMPTGGHRLLVEVRSRSSFALFGREVKVGLHAPIGTDVTAETGSADVVVVGDVGSITVRTGSGDLSFDRSGSDVSVKVASGNVRGRIVEGKLSVDTASGDVKVDEVRDSAICRTASGDLELGAVGGSMDFSSASGDIRIGSAWIGVVQARTMSGDVTVGVAAGTNVWLDLSSKSGETVSELDAVDAPEGDANPLELRLSSMSGDVRVHRSKGAAKAAID
jgi:putative adhesin